MLSSLLEQANPVYFLDHLLLSQCTGAHRFQADVPACHDLGLQDAAKISGGFLTEINKLLDSQSPQPVGFGYCADRLLQNNPSNDCGRHASLIIRRRRNPASGKCHDMDALLRNIQHVSYLETPAP